MIGHATLSAVDPDKPASLSRRVVQQIVRDGWQHDGILITDDLSMGAVARHGLCSAGVDAVGASIDLLLVSYDIEQYFTVLHCLMNALRDGNVDRALLETSDRRLERLGGRIDLRHRSAGAITMRPSSWICATPTTAASSCWPCTARGWTRPGIWSTNGASCR